MAYLVIAVGLLMSLAGGYLLNYGYAIVQVERGWSSVIAGSVFVSGGLVTMGLGLVLRGLTEMQRALVGAGVTAARVGAPALAPSDPPHAELAGPESIAPPALAGAVEPSFAPREIAAAHDLDHPHDGAPTTALDQGEHTHESPVTRQDHAAEPHAAEPQVTETHAAEPYAAEPNAAADHRADDAALTARVAPPAPTSSAAAREEAPAMDDWLDRAFSDLDAAPPRVSPQGEVVRGKVVRGGPPRMPFPRGDRARRADPVAVGLVPEEPSAVEPIHPEPAPPPPAYVEPAHLEPAHLEPARVEPVQSDPFHGESLHAEPAPVEPVHAEATRPAPSAAAAASPVPPSPEPAVIGRYESDDTSYVMYADGSIEAHSPAGVYRFASMAELKAFIEG